MLHVTRLWPPRSLRFLQALLLEYEQYTSCKFGRNLKLLDGHILVTCNIIVPFAIPPCLIILHVTSYSQYWCRAFDWNVNNMTAPGTINTWIELLWCAHFSFLPCPVTEQPISPSSPALSCPSYSLLTISKKGMSNTLIDSNYGIEEFSIF